MTPTPGRRLHPPESGGPGSGRWDPWRALAQRPHIELRRHPIAELTGGAMLIQVDGLTVIVLHPDLDRVAQRCALAHELVHEERGGGCDRRDQPETWDPVAAREERKVDAIVAARLVPRAELRRLAASRVEGPGLTASEVAESFEVSAHIAAVALRALGGEQASDGGPGQTGVP